MCTIIFLNMNRLNKTKSAFLVSLICSLLPEDLHSELILTSLQLPLCRVAALKRAPYIIIVLIIFFWSFMIIWLMLKQFKNRVPLRPVLGLGEEFAPLHYCT